MPSSSPARSLLEKIEPAVSLLLACLALGLVLARIAGDSPTVDEPVHITAGYETLTQGTWSWNPEHPPLAKAGAALGLLGLSLEPPGSPYEPGRRLANLRRFLIGNRVPVETIVFRARLFSVALFALLLAAVRREARARFGPLAGAFALALAAFEPTLQAHAGLVHTDLPVACFLVLALRPLARLADGDTRLSAPLALGALWGLMLLSKYNAPLLAVLSLGVLLVPGTVRPSARFLSTRILGAAGVAACVSLLGFALAGRNQTPEVRELLAREICTEMGREPELAKVVVATGRVFPAAGNLLNGVLSVALQNRAPGVNFYRGMVSTRGFRSYFPFALATKCSLGLLAATLLGAALAKERGFVLALLGALALFLLISSFSNYNRGVRHALFVFPALALVAGAALAPAAGRGRALAAGAVLSLQIVECVRVAPHPLAFFNALAGGPGNGRTLLVDSNLDWGQDLARLAALAPGISREPLPALVWSGGLVERHPSLRLLRPADVEKPGQLLAMGETPLAIGPEFYAARGNPAEARAFEAVRKTLRERGERVGSVGDSIGLWRIR